MINLFFSLFKIIHTFMKNLSFIDSARLSLLCSMQDFCSPARSWSPCPLHWECRVLTNGLPGKSQNFIYLKVKDEEKPGQPYIVGASVNWYNDFGNLPQYFLQLNIHVPLTSSSPPEYVANGNECFTPPEGVREHVHSSCLHDHPLWKQLRSPAAVEGEIHCDVSIQWNITRQ